MGSFASSLHIRSEDAAAVSRAIAASLAGDGFALTEEPLDQEARWGMSESHRAIQVSEPRQGWVSILESDPMSNLALGADLSKRLKTYALHVFVNDSDSWHYHLFHRGRQIDSFDSLDDEDEWNEDWEKEEQGVGPGQVKVPVGKFSDITTALQGKAQQIEALMTAAMPEEIKGIYARMRSGGASPEEMQTYMQWATKEMPKRMDQMQQLIADALSGAGLDFAIPRISKTGEDVAPDDPPESERDYSQHVERLRPILAADVSAEHARDVLAREALFAEETLGEFLPLVSIAPAYANLSYRYLEEFPESELASQGIKMAAHLKFRSEFEA